MCAVANWASLPPNVCQQILSTYEETLRDGAEVCKAWNSIANVDGLGPANLDVLCDYVTDREAEEQDLVGKWMVEKLEIFASLHLRSVKLAYGGGIVANGDWVHEEVIEVLARKSPLCTQVDFSIPWLADWSVLDALPNTLQKLSLDYLDLADKPSLQALNSLVNITELSLAFQGNWEGLEDVNMVVEGDLVLPSLQVLRLHRPDICNMYPYDGDYSPVVLAHFTGTQIPQDCLVVCHDLVQMSSKHSAWTECFWYEYATILPFDNISVGCRLA